MPVFTAAVLSISAVSLATAATAAATIATAAVSVSAAIGVAGLAVSAVGMITKNKDLLKVGKIMGYVGLAGSLAGGALGGIGGLMEGGTGFINGASDAFAGASQHLSDAWQADKSFVSGLFQPDVAQGVVSGTGGMPGATAGVGETANAAAPSSFTPMPTEPALGNPVTADMGSVAGQIPPTNLAASPAQNITGTGIADQGLSQTTFSANAGPAAPSAPTAPGVSLSGADPFGVTNPITSGASGGSMGPMDSLKQLLPNGGSPTSGKGLWDSMPDYMKYATVTGGVATLPGVMGGLFKGLSAEEQLNFEKMVNQQRENQVQYQNKNNQYSPLVKFSRPTGFINQVGRA